jgi:hypothetical protein
MSASATTYMLEQMSRYFEKIKTLAASGGAGSFKYVTGVVPANGQLLYDAPTELGFNVAQYNIYSMQIQLSMVDPTVAVTPPVVDALSVLRYEIQPDGKVLIRNNFDADITYHARFALPVKI